MGLFGKKQDDKKTVSQADAGVASTASNEKSRQPAPAVAVKQSAQAKAYSTIVSPLISEKSHQAIATGKYTFRVGSDANKKSIRKAISDLHSVTVTSVNIVSMPKKRRTIKYDRGYQGAYKKAIVTLKKGDRIADLELS